MTPIGGLIIFMLGFVLGIMTVGVSYMIYASSSTELERRINRDVKMLKKTRKREKEEEKKSV